MLPDRSLRILTIPLVLFIASGALPALSGEAPTLDSVLDAIIQRENDLAVKLGEYHPLIETYIQTLEPDRHLGSVPSGDDYFLGRLTLPRSGAAKAPAGHSDDNRQLLDLFKNFYAYNLGANGFARMIVLDAESFDRSHYAFEFVRREFLGEVRTLVFEVTPNDPSQAGRFTGRIWVEDEAYSIVRYNGAFTSRSRHSIHFDSWRLNLQPGFWFPAYIYTEESDYRPKGRLKSRMFRGQTRIWGYELERSGGEQEFTKVVVDTPRVTDRTERPGDISPVTSLRTWKREAEDNVLRRLEKAAFLAPEGEIDEVLRTVVANLEITNSLDIQPPVRCRILLTSPLESFTVGHTIILSRGLIDVLPDEASLAMTLAHELGHILLGHQLDTRYAFSDRMLIGDKEALEEFLFRRDAEEEAEADEKAMMLLGNSPYKDKLDNAGLFLKILSRRSKPLRALISPHFGNRLAKKEKLYRMTRIEESAPQLYPTALNQTAALPLGGRVKVDPWTGRIELMKNSREVLLSPHEKKPLEITPLMPHLVRLSAPRRDVPLQTGTGEEANGEEAVCTDTAVHRASAEGRDIASTTDQPR
jgi:hypothetical protein